MEVIKTITLLERNYYFVKFPHFVNPHWIYIKDNQVYYVDYLDYIKGIGALVGITMIITVEDMKVLKSLISEA